MFGRNNEIDIVVNGKSFQCSGKNICIQNGRITVNGRVLDCNMTRDIHVVVNGNINQLQCAGSVEVNGSCGSVDCAGSCTVSGDVNGNIDATGSVTCGNVFGNIDAAGSVRCRQNRP